MESGSRHQCRHLHDARPRRILCACRRNTLARAKAREGRKGHAGNRWPNHQRGYSAVIYLCGTGQEQLDDAAQRCREYASRFGWPVLESIRASGTCASTGYLLTRVSQPSSACMRTTHQTLERKDQHLAMTSRHPSRTPDSHRPDGNPARRLNSARSCRRGRSPPGSSQSPRHAAPGQGSPGV